MKHLTRLEIMELALEQLQEKSLWITHGQENEYAKNLYCKIAELDNEIYKLKNRQKGQKGV